MFYSWYFDDVDVKVLIVVSAINPFITRIRFTFFLHIFCMVCVCWIWMTNRFIGRQRNYQYCIMSWDWSLSGRMSQTQPVTLFNVLFVPVSTCTGMLHRVTLSFLSICTCNFWNFVFCERLECSFAGYLDRPLGTRIFFVAEILLTI